MSKGRLVRVFFLVGWGGSIFSIVGQGQVETFFWWKVLTH